MIQLFKINFDSKRIYGLDILRSIAILSVLYAHFRHILTPHINMRIYEFFMIDGVTIFFVLSGFLIGGILIKTIDSSEFRINDLLVFWKRRWYRTLPNYFLIFTLLVILYIIKFGTLPPNAIYYFFFIQNFYYLVPSDFFPEAWSLSIEEWFYLLIPTFIFITLKLGFNKRKTLFFWIISIIVICTLIRLSLALKYNCEEKMCWVIYLRQLVVTRMDSMMFGVLGAFLNYFYEPFWNKNKNINFYIGISLIIFPQIYDFIANDMFFKNYLIFTFTSFGTLLLLPKLCDLKNGSGMIYKFFTYTSLISYSIYLLHYGIVYVFILAAFQRFLPILNSHNFIICLFNYFSVIIITYLLSTLLYKYFEMPMTKLRGESKNQHGRK